MTVQTITNRRGSILVNGDGLKLLSGVKYGLEVYWVLAGDKVVGKFLSEAAARSFIKSKNNS